MDNTEKSAKRRQRAKAERGAVRVNVELRDEAATQWNDLKEAHGAAGALTFLLDQQRKRNRLTKAQLLAMLEGRLTD